MVLIVVAVVARQHDHPAVVSMCVVSLGGLLGAVVLLASTPLHYYLSFIWVNLVIWIVGICVWLTLGLAVVTAIRPRLASIRDTPYNEIQLSAPRRPAAVVVVLGAACIAGTLVAVFPYGNQFLLNWNGVARVKQMTADIERHVPVGKVGIGVFCLRDRAGLRRVSDEHGAAYLLLTDGWVPGMEPQIDQLLGLPIDRHSPFVVFTERGQKLLGAKYLPKYETLWFFNHICGSRVRQPVGLWPAPPGPTPT